MNIAIIVSVSEYDHQTNMGCCYEDAQAIKQIISSIDKYDMLKTYSNLKARDLKNELRDLFSKIDNEDIHEVFFYFSGHGYMSDDEFFFCGADFISAKQNETGLSQSELHQFIRPCSPRTTVQIVDACCSGNKIVKSADQRISDKPAGFNSYLHFASSMDNEISAPGNPLSPFTSAVQSALLSFESGPIYYMDLSSKIRDVFLNRKGQTPYFSSQATGREVFTDDAKKLERLRNVLNYGDFDDKEVTEISDSEADLTAPVSNLTKLEEIEKRRVERVLVEKFIASVFASFAAKTEGVEEFDGIYKTQFIRESEYEYNETRNFIVQVMVKQDVSDALVSTEIVRTRKKKRQPRFGAIFDSLYEPEYEENIFYQLELNCSLEHVQLVVLFDPLFQSLWKFKLIISVVPTLTKCYVFEHMSVHKLNDWDSYEEDGSQVDRGWRQFMWTEEEALAELNLFERYKKKIIEHIESVSSMQTSH